METYKTHSTNSEEARFHQFFYSRNSLLKKINRWLEVGDDTGIVKSSRSPNVQKCLWFVAIPCILLTRTRWNTHEDSSQKINLIQRLFSRICYVSKFTGTLCSFSQFQRIQRMIKSLVWGVTVTISLSILTKSQTLQRKFRVLTDLKKSVYFSIFSLFFHCINKKTRSKNKPRGSSWNCVKILKKNLLPLT